MANTKITILDEMGTRVPSLTQVTIVVGDTITFSETDGSSSVLYFSPETASLLTPTPADVVGLDTGEELTYTFGAPEPGAYGVIAGSPDFGPPPAFDFGQPADPPVLVIQSSSEISYTGPANSVKD